MADADSESPSEWYDDVLHHLRRLAPILSADVVAVLVPPQDHVRSSMDAVADPPQPASDNAGSSASPNEVVPDPPQPAFDDAG